MPTKPPEKAEPWLWHWRVRKSSRWTVQAYRASTLALKLFKTVWNLHQSISRVQGIQQLLYFFTTFKSLK